MTSAAVPTRQLDRTIIRLAIPSLGMLVIEPL
jgi:hypothetical protein